MERRRRGVQARHRGASFCSLTHLPHCLSPPSSQNFLDLPHLRRTYGPFLTISEFFDLYQLPSADYDQTQVWNATTYNPEGLTTSTVPADVFQNRTFVRVDGKIPSSDVDDENDGADGFTAAEVQKALGSRVTWTIPNAKEALRKAGAHVEALNEGELLSRLTALGAVPLYTFDDECGCFLPSLPIVLVEITVPAECS